MAGSIQRLAVEELDLSTPPTGDIAVFVIAGCDDGASPTVRASAVAAVLASEPVAEILVFLDEGSLAEDRGFVGQMLAEFDPAVNEVTIRAVPAIDAIKRVSGQRVVEAVDRSTVLLLRSPQIIARQALEVALGAINESTQVNPSVLAASYGAMVQVFEL